MSRFRSSLGVPYSCARFSKYQYIKLNSSNLVPLRLLLEYFSTAFEICLTNVLNADFQDMHFSLDGKLTLIILQSASCRVNISLVNSNNYVKCSFHKKKHFKVAFEIVLTYFSAYKIFQMLIIYKLNVPVEILRELTSKVIYYLMLQLFYQFLSICSYSLPFIFKYSLLVPVFI